jgi:predicted metal-dependent enzyme (double-stranded beta helix superfamily)
MFDVEEFVAACYAALREHSPQAAMKELVERTMSRPGEVEAALGTPTRAELATIHRSPELTVLNVIWAPGMSIYPHDHRMWAVIGIYGGQEDNTFYRRSPQGLVVAGGKELHSKDSVLLGDKVIHAVANPRQTLTGAIHVYGGDFFATQRSEWDPETLEERPYDVEKARQQFVLANERYAAQQASARQAT